MKNSFSTGFFIALFTMGLIQDYIGQEAYIQFLTEHWINIDWRWYLIPLIYLNVELFQNERYNRIIVSLLKQGKPIPEYFTFPKDPEEEQTYTDIKGNEYIFKNGIWKTTKNIKEELNKFNFDEANIVKSDVAFVDVDNREENHDTSDKDVSWVADFNGQPMRIREAGDGSVELIKSIPPKEET